MSNGTERFGYSADSDFARRIAAAGVGYKGSPAWRVGAGIAFSLVDLRLVQGISDRIADAAGLQTLLVAGRASGSALQVRAQGGVQYDTPHIRYGAPITTPGLTIRRERTVTLDGTLDLGPASLGATLFDGNARFEYRLPWELLGGVAYVRDRVEVEVDVQGYTSIAAYSLLATDQPTLIYGDMGIGGPASVISRPFDGLTSASTASSTWLSEATSDPCASATSASTEDLPPADRPWARPTRYSTRLTCLCGASASADQWRNSNSPWASITKSGRRATCSCVIS